MQMLMIILVMLMNLEERWKKGRKEGRAILRNSSYWGEYVRARYNLGVDAENKGKATVCICCIHWWRCSAGDVQF